MPADDLTPGQVAELLHVDGSTLRRWARFWRVHLSEQGRAKRRRFTQGDLATFARGQQLLRAGKSPTEAAEILSTTPADVGSVPAVASVSVPALAQALQAAQEGLRAMQGELDGLRQAQAGQADEISALKAQLAAWERLPWWRRLFGGPRPPAEK